MSILQQRASDVRTQEINLSQVITSESSAVSCQVIVSKQGRTEETAFSNAQDYLAEYGNPNAQVSMDVYTGLNFFKEGNLLWCKRVVGADAKYAAVLLYETATGTKLAPIAGGVADPKQPEWDDLLPADGTEAIALFYPRRGPGSHGDSLAVAIQSNDVLSPADLAVNSEATGGILVAGEYEYQIAAIGETGEVLASNPVTIVIAGAETTNVNVLTWSEVPFAVGYRIYGRDDATVGLLAEVGQGTSTFTDTGEITVDTDELPKTSPSELPPASPTFALSFFDTAASSSYALETFDCSLVPYTDGDGSETELEERINPFSAYMQVTSNVSSLITAPTVGTVPLTNLQGGDSGTAPTSFQIAAAYEAFSNKQVYPINIIMNAGRGDPNIQKSIDSVAQGRGDAIGLLDVPSSKQDFQSAINYRKLELNLNSSYSALFAPDVLQADNINGKQQYVPFSGWAAALCARTDRVANPSFSIAGLNRGLVDILKARHTYEDGQASAMFRAQVNYTRTFTSEGTALWEQQTLATQQSALSWLSVRRITNVIKTSIYKFLVYSLQEPNDEFLGRQIVGSCSDYLELVKNARGITSYSVVSDSSNNSVAMFNSAQRRVTVIIVPTLPLHELLLDVVISKQGVSFTEVLRQVSGG